MHDVVAYGPYPTEAFAQALNTLQWPLVGFVRGLIHDEEQARDIVQDVFVDAWKLARQGSPPFTGAPDNDDGVRRWLFHVAYRRAVSAYRRRKIIDWQPLEPAMEALLPWDGEPQPFDDQIVEREVLRNALQKLSIEDAACVLLHAVWGLTSTEIAEILDISLAAAKKRLTRARQRLRASYFEQNRTQGEAPR
jgi:RNA polymerase sigma-70 factor, ECF subfamily